VHTLFIVYLTRRAFRIIVIFLFVVHSGMLGMAAPDSDSDEFFDAKDNWMSPTVSVREQHNTSVHTFVS